MIILSHCSFCIYDYIIHPVLGAAQGVHILLSAKHTAGRISPGERIPVNRMAEDGLLNLCP